MKINKEEFKVKMRRTRSAFMRAAKKEAEIFDLIDDTFGRMDLEAIPSDAENAENLHEAISCYLQYGEYDLDLLWDELTMGYNTKSVEGGSNETTA